MNESNDPKIEQMLGELRPVEPSSQLDQRMKTLFAEAQVQTAGPYPWSMYARRASAIAAVMILATSVGWFMMVSTPMRPSESSNNRVNTGETPVVHSTDSSSGQVAESSVVTAGASSTGGPTAIQVGETQVIDGGFATTPTGDAVRVLRRESVQRSAWVDPQTKAIVQVEEPSEEIVLVSANTF